MYTHSCETYYCRSQEDQPKADLLKHQVGGYDPDDITITTTNDGRIKVEGKHICHCNENCITREFARSYQIPSSIDISSLTATMDIDGNIKVQGSPSRHSTNTAFTSSVKVKGLGIPQSTRLDADQLRQCLAKKGGIKLNKINKQTGEIHEDEASFKYSHEVLPTSLDQQDEATFDQDDGFVEIEDNY